MRKGIVIILAVAVIGALGLIKNHKGDDAAPLATPSDTSAVMSAQTGQNDSTPSDSSAAAYEDGTYTGASEDTIYGTVQIAAVVSGGKITDIKFLQMPGPEGHSKEVTAFAEPYLKQSTLAHQGSNIDFVSGATQTSEAYERSLQAALDQAA